MNDRTEKIKTLLVIWALFFVMVICMVFVLIRSLSKEEPLGSPLPMDTRDFLEDVIAFDAPDDLAAMVEENLIAYLYKAYIVIGTYPEAQLVKISANVARNDFNWKEEFYCPEGELYWLRYKDGVSSGRIAIDVSEYQNNIDWQRVHAAGVDVAIVRAGYRGYGSGTLVKDTMFDTNITGALNAGVEVGAYFFSEAINREEGIEEAEYILSMLSGYNITQPVVIDTEYIYDTEGVRANDLSVEDRTAAVVGFCETIEAAGYTPMIYASRDQFIFNLDIDAIGKYEFWLAAYDTPNFPYHTEGYQYSPYGLMDGIERNVDLDVWMR